MQETKSQSNKEEWAEKVYTQPKIWGIQLDLASTTNETSQATTLLTLNS